MSATLSFEIEHLSSDDHPEPSDFSAFASLHLRRDFNTTFSTTNASRSSRRSINTPSTNIDQRPFQHQNANPKSRSSSTSNNSCKSSEWAPHPDTHNNNNNSTHINNELFAHLLHGRTADGLLMMMKNEVSYSFEPVSEPDSEHGKRDLVEDAETRKGNMRGLVQGQAGMYPKRRVKGWGATEINRGTRLEEKQGFVEGDMIDLMGEMQAVVEEDLIDLIGVKHGFVEEDLIDLTGETQPVVEEDLIDLTGETQPVVEEDLIDLIGLKHGFVEEDLIDLTGGTQPVVEEDSIEL